MSKRPGLLAAALLLAAGAALAWWPHGHKVIAEAAVRALPSDMPRFFRKSAAALAAYSIDPDVVKNEAVPSLRQHERPQHYIDLELLKGEPVPPTRAEFDALCARLRVAPDQVGTLPYTIQREYERLVMAFAEHRRKPSDRAIQAKILYIAGALSHYTADAAQPLHTTVHFDGRVGDDGKSPRSGIHAKMDALPGNAALKADEAAKGLEVKAVKDVFAAALAVIEASHRLVDTVYSLETRLPPAENKMPTTLDHDIRDFALERARAGAAFTASLWYSAWLNSADVVLPDWYNGASGGQ